jgi:hypothetical protein
MGNSSVSEALISIEEARLLAAALVSAGIKPDSKRSIRRVLQILQWLKSDIQYIELGKVFLLRGLPHSATKCVRNPEHWTDMLSRSITPWGASNFQKVLELVRYLGPTRWGIGIAMQIRGKGFQGFERLPGSGADRLSA